jgi:anti-sigma-K factor RskA
MSEPERERDQAIAAYLVGELDEADRAEFDRRLAGDPGLRDEVEALRGVASSLAMLPEQAWTPPEPPRLSAPGEAVPQGPAPRARPAWRWTPARLAATAGVAALLLGSGIWIGTLVDEDPGGAGSLGGSSIALTPLRDGDAARGELTVAEDDGDRASLSVSGLAPNRNDFYEVWLLGDRGLVSLGSFRVGAEGSATAELALPVDPARYGSFDVSLEPDDGDPSHSSDSVLRGPAAS